MKKYIVLFLLNIFAVIIQTSFLSELIGYKLNPNLVAVLVFYFVLNSDLDSAYWSALIGGLLLDTVSGGIIGLGTFSLAVFVLLYSNLRNFYLRSFLAGLLFAACYFYLSRLVVARVILFDGWIFVGALLTAALGKLFSFSIKSGYEKITF